MALNVCREAHGSALLLPPLTAAAPAAHPLRAAPATDGAACADRPTPEGFTCQQQAGWGKCGEAWMAEGGFCAATCGRCTGGSEATAPAASPPANATAPAPPSSLNGKLAEYGKVRWAGGGVGGLVGRGMKQHHVRLPPRLTPAQPCFPYPTLPLQALSLSWRFYYAQRSGKLSGTANPVPWRGDSHLDDPVPGEGGAGCVAVRRLASSGSEALASMPASPPPAMHAPLSPCMHLRPARNHHPPTATLPQPQAASTTRATT